MHVFRAFLGLCAAASAASAASWPYDRYHESCHPRKGCFVDHKKPEFGPDQATDDLFVDWFRSIVNKDQDGALARSFRNRTLPTDVRGLSDIEKHLDDAASGSKNNYTSPATSEEEARELFAHLEFPLDPECIRDKSKYWYRTYDGSCNWLKEGEFDQGIVGQAKPRDYKQYAYADGISEPRAGPNARAVSNAFFQRKDSIYYEHTPLLLGLIEFIMHDVTYSQDSEDEYIEVEVPDDEQVFEKGTKFRVQRTQAIKGTGTSKSNPREISNQATAWLDLSALYGSTEEVAKKLRSFHCGKLLTEEHQGAGTKKPASYLPWNSMNVPTRTRPGVKPESLFAGGDPRTNEDWLMLGVHTLLLREHNRLCDILAGHHPEYDDEQLYQTIRLVMSTKYVLIANAYQMAYWTDKMPWPRDDGFPLYRQMYGKGAMQINPANSYPWPLVTKGGKPMIASAEMGVAYRFHEFIIPEFPIVDAANNSVRTQNLFQTGFDAQGFVDTGLENILRGTVGTTIPNFKSGVDEAFRSAGKYRGRPFDIVTWSIVHEREQGIPTFNQYYRAYNEQDPEVEVPIRNNFEDFSSDPKMVAKLKELYSHPDEVDLVVGVQLDEEMFPGTTVPKSALIVSLFSLFGVGNSDRFSVGFAMMRCLLVDSPFDCHPSNALEDLLWKRREGHENHPDFRFYDSFWLQELDLQAHGTNLLWRLITENTEIKCIQQRPLFPANDKTNPILCSLPQTSGDTFETLASAGQVFRALVLQRKIEVLAGAVAMLILLYIRKQRKWSDEPPLMGRYSLLGRAKTFGKNPLKVLDEGRSRFHAKVFGIKVALQKHYILVNAEDMEMMMHDNPYEVKFGLKEFFESIKFNVITKDINFSTDLHTKLVKENLDTGEKIARFHGVIEEASTNYLMNGFLTSGSLPKKHPKGLNQWATDFIAYVFSRFIVGPKGFDNKELLKTFVNFQKNATWTMVVSGILPPGFRWIAAWSLNRDYNKIWKHLKPIIKERRAALEANGWEIDVNEPAVFMDHIILAVQDDDHRVSDIVALLVYGGLANLQSAFTSSFLDIINKGKDFQDHILSSLDNAVVGNLDACAKTPAWAKLRSATFESIRLAGPAISPARLLLQDQQLKSEAKTLRQGVIAELSAHYVHRDTRVWGPDAAAYKPERFLHEDPRVGEIKYISWGLKGPHLCPGRWLALATIQIMLKNTLEQFVFVQDEALTTQEAYEFPDPASVVRTARPITVSLRDRDLS